MDDLHLIFDIFLYLSETVSIKEHYCHCEIDGTSQNLCYFRLSQRGFIYL